MKVASNEWAEERYRALLDSLPTGQAKAVSMNDLCRRHGMKSAELRAWVLSARIDGCFICSGQNGYYLPDNESELRDYINRRNTVIDTAEKAINPSIQFVIGL